MQAYYLLLFFGQIGNGNLDRYTLPLLPLLPLRPLLSRRKPAMRLAGSGPWQWKQFSERIGRMSRSKEIGSDSRRGIEALLGTNVFLDLHVKVAKDWQRNLGVSVSLDQKELKVYRNDLKKANYMVTRAGWYADYGDPTTFLEVNRSNDGNNDRKYNNPGYDGLLDQARVETDPAARMAILAEAERIIMEEDLPMVPLYHYVTVYLFDPDKVSGVNPHPRATQNVFLIDVLGDGKGPDTPRTMPRLPAGGRNPDEASP